MRLNQKVGELKERIDYILSAKVKLFWSKPVLPLTLLSLSQKFGELKERIDYLPISNLFHGVYNKVMQNPDSQSSIGAISKVISMFLCYKVSEQSLNLKVSKVMQHILRGGYKCPDCNTKFSTKERLIDHSKSHEKLLRK